MIAIKHKISNDTKQIKCFNIVWDENDPKFGFACERRLLDKNSNGEVAGEIKCLRCQAIYEIKDNELILINNGEKK